MRISCRKVLSVEKDLHECYSGFLSTITDAEKRHKQLETFKRLGLNAPDSVSNLLTENIEDEHELRFSNVLKRTVERVLVETEPYYHVESDVIIKDEEADDVDVKLYK